MSAEFQKSPVVFADAGMDERFLADGVVGPFPVLDASDTREVLNRLQPLVPHESPFYTMHREGDSPARRREIASVINELVEPALSGMLVRYRLFLGGSSSSRPIPRAVCMSPLSPMSSNGE